MVIGVVGMGLIGGSLVKAIKKNTKHKVYGFDISEETVKSALQEKSIDKKLTSENLKECDYVFIPLYPEAVKDYLIKNAKNFKENAVVIDCAGVKRCVCDDCFDIAENNGFTFIGGHPMAGTQFSGYENSKDTMFYIQDFQITFVLMLLNKSYYSKVIVYPTPLTKSIDLTLALASSSISPATIIGPPDGSINFADFLLSSVYPTLT